MTKTSKKIRQKKDNDKDKVTKTKTKTKTEAQKTMKKQRPMAHKK